jgi:hypothetical protein
LIGAHNWLGKSLRVRLPASPYPLPAFICRDPASTRPSSHFIFQIRVCPNGLHCNSAELTPDVLGPHSFTLHFRWLCPCDVFHLLHPSRNSTFEYFKNFIMPSALYPAAPCCPRIHLHSRALLPIAFTLSFHRFGPPFYLRQT